MDKYTDHLYALVRNKADFIATKDLHSKEGKLLFKAGERILAKQNLSLHKSQSKNLIKKSTALADQLTPNALYEKIDQLINADPCFKAIDKGLAQANVLHHCCDSLKKYPPLLEILTLYSIEMPELFDQSLHIAYLIYIYGADSKMPQSDIEAAFLAGLFHDSGLLFISRKITNKQGKLTGEEWNKIKLHPIVAFKMLRHIEDFPDGARKAILDHHECPDGSGYCLGKTEKDISELAPLVSIMDDIFVIYIKKFKPIGRSLTDVSPIIQINTHGYPREFISGVLKILKHIEPPPTPEIPKKIIRDLIEYTYQQQLYINKFCEIMEKVSETLDENNYDSEKVTILQEAWAKTMVSITSSGIQESSYIDWLVRADTDDRKSLFEEIEYSRLMLEEVVYQINSYYNYVNSSLDKRLALAKKDFHIFTHIYLITEKPSIPSSLQAFWEKMSVQQLQTIL